MPFTLPPFFSTAINAMTPGSSLTSIVATLSSFIHIMTIAALEANCSLGGDSWHSLADVDLILSHGSGEFGEKVKPGLNASFVRILNRGRDGFTGRIVDTTEDIDGRGGCEEGCGQQ